MEMRESRLSRRFHRFRIHETDHENGVRSAIDYDGCQQPLVVEFGFKNVPAFDGISGFRQGESSRLYENDSLLQINHKLGSKSSGVSLHSFVAERFKG